MRRLFVLACAATLSSAALGGTFVANWSYGSIGNIATSSGTVGATKFTATRTGGTDTLLTFNANNQYMTFCAELNEHIGGGSNIHQNVELLNGSGTQTTIASGTVFSMARTVALEKLWGWALAGNVNFSDNTQIFGFQLAQWNLLFDNSIGVNSPDWNVNTGAGLWGASSGPANVITTANNILGSASIYTGQRAAVYLLQGYGANFAPGIQDQITARLGPPPGSNTPVPEPFTMGLGIAAVGAYVRRRAKAANG